MNKQIQEKVLRNQDTSWSDYEKEEIKRLLKILFADTISTRLTSSQPEI